MFCDYNSVIHTRSWPQEGLHGKSITDQEQKHANQHRVTTVVQHEADVDDGQFFVGGEAGSVAVQEQRVVDAISRSGVCSYPRRLLAHMRPVLFHLVQVFIGMLVFEQMPDEFVGQYHRHRQDVSKGFEVGGLWPPLPGPDGNNSTILLLARANSANAKPLD